MRNSAFIKVIVAIILGAIVGLASGTDSSIFGVSLVRIYSLIGQLFLNALNLVVIPLVMSSIISGTGRMGQEGAFGTLGLKTFTAFFLTTLSAILVGYFLVNIFNPGISQNLASLTSVNLADIQAQVDSQDTFAKIEQIFLKLVPSNIVAVAAQGQMLGIIMFSILFGYFLSKIESQTASLLISFWNGIFQVMMKITHLVMKTLPIGVFGLVAKVMATTGLSALTSVGLFSLTVVVALAIYSLVILSLMLKLISGASPLAHLKAMGPALVTAFSTSSSAATLPVSMECVEKNGVPNKISSFLLPLGTSLNLTGTSLHICISVFFIAQVYGVALPLTSQLLVILMTLIISFGLPGIPSAGLVAILLILQTIGLPAEGVGLIMAVERLLDMARTAVNVYGTSCCALMVARSQEKESLEVST